MKDVVKYVDLEAKEILKILGQKTESGKSVRVWRYDNTLFFSRIE
jgi:predicted nucleic acid-binding Zn finger protein